MVAEDKPIEQTTTPKLEDWLRLGDRLVGYIYGDNRFADGNRIRTSRVLKIDHQLAVTAHTTYRLGKPHSTMQG